jgi:hypothetical protein
MPSSSSSSSNNSNSNSVGLCEHCRYVHLVRSDRGAVFYQCKLSFTDPRFKKYPSLPVLSCPGYEAK